MNIIGFSGKINTGKTVLMTELAKLMPGYVFNFGDILKEEVASIYGFDLELCYTDDGKDTEVFILGIEPIAPKPKMTVRGLLQWYGTDYMRKRDPDHWVKCMSDKFANTLMDSSDNVYFGDIRFPNEANFVTETLGGKVVRMLPFQSQQINDKHDSEVALDDFEKKRYFWLQIAPPFGKLKETAKYIKELLS